MRFVRVRVPYGEAARVSAQLGANYGYHFATDDGALLLWCHFRSEEEARRAAALAVLLGYDVSNEESVPP